LIPLNLEKSTNMPSSVEDFGILPNREKVRRFTLSNDHGLTLKAINYGGIITELHAPDRQGHAGDVVLGLKNLQAYLDGHPYFGAIVGRVAGRITAARFNLDGQAYPLVCNDPPNHLHGGINGFDKKLWAAEAAENGAGDPCLTLSYTSPDGEEGYPGNVCTTVTYTLTPQNELRIDYTATTDKPTPFSLTSHSYFNLAGEGSGTIGNHLLQIHTDRYVPADDQMTLSGRIESLEGQTVDFRQQKPMAEIIGEPLHTHGDNYVIRQGTDDAVVPVATVIDPSSGRILDVFSSASCLQFYTAKFLGQDNLKGKSGIIYGAHDGFCLECHGYPDGINAPEIDDITLRPGETYRQITVYRFSTLSNE
jgi:aldose 1-epimerase